MTRRLRHKCGLGEIRLSSPDNEGSGRVIRNCSRIVMQDNTIYRDLEGVEEPFRGVVSCFLDAVPLSPRWWLGKTTVRCTGDNSNNSRNRKL